MGRAWCEDCEDNEDTGDMRGCSRHRDEDEPTVRDIRDHVDLAWSRYDAAAEDM